MAKMRMKTSETLSIVCYILQIFLEIFPIELSVSAFYLLKAVLCVPIAVCIYITKSKPLFRILAISSLLVLSIPSDYLPNKINILIYIITAVFAGIVYVIYESKKTRRTEADLPAFVLLFASFLSIMNCMNQSGYYTHTKSTLSYTIICWSIALLLSVSYFIFKKGKDSNQTKSHRFIIALLIFILSGMFISSTYYNLNYILDSEEPQEYTVKIADMRKTNGGRRRRRRYYLSFSINGEEYEIQISSGEYIRYKVGDSYIVYYYNGAFDQPFLISGKYSD